MPANSCNWKEEECQQPKHEQTGRGIRERVPEEIAVDAANSPHLADLGSQANDLDPHVCAVLNDDVGVVGELRRCGAGVVLDFVGHQLRDRLASKTHNHHLPPVGGMRAPYVGRDKETQWPSLREEAMWVHRLGDGVDLAAVSAEVAQRVAPSDTTC